MKFVPTPLDGAMLIQPEPYSDERGWFARLWCEREAIGAGITAQIVQTNLSMNRRKGTVRGMHLQLPPSREGKLVSCIRGEVFDVIVDLRPQSSTFLKYFKTELSEANLIALWVPPMMAHGFMTLCDDSTVLYGMSDFHAPELAAGLRWNDPLIGIGWPTEDAITIVERDASYPDFEPEAWASRVAEAPGRM